MFKFLSIISYMHHQFSFQMSNIIQSLESCSFTECDEKTDDDYDDDDDIAGQGAVERLGNTANEKDASEVLKPVANLEF